MEKAQNRREAKNDSSDVSEDSSTSSNQTFLKTQNIQEKEHQTTLNISPVNSSKFSVAEEQSRSSQTDQEEEFRKKQKEEIDSEHRFIWESLKNIEGIMREVEVLRPQIEEFSGCSTDDRDYIYLEEMMIRATVALDKVETNGNSLIRLERKRAVQYIQKLMKILDSRMKENKRQIEYYRYSRDNDDDDSY